MGLKSLAHKPDFAPLVNVHNLVARDKADFKYAPPKTYAFAETWIAD